MKSFTQLLTIIAIIFVAYWASTKAEQKSFDFQGTYLEGCSCNTVCSCDINGGMVPGCHVMGVMIISSGNYHGKKLSGGKIAFAVADKWVRIYLQTSDKDQFEIISTMCREMFAEYGTIESIRNADVKLTGNDGNYTLSVDNGQVILLKTKPILGADGKTAVTYTNYPDPLFHTIMQGRVESGSYNDGEHHFTLENSNSFFNQEWQISGRM